MSIPKITHQIWMQGFENIPEKFKKNVDDLHRLNPEYKHKQWDEKSLRTECLKYSTECAERFDSFDQMIMKVDLGRYVVLHNYGGISVDTDMVQLRSIANTPGINTDTFIIGKSGFPYNLTGYLNNGVIITIPKHTIIITVINEIINDTRKCSDFTTKESCVQVITGPKHITDIINNNKELCKILDNKYYEPCTSLDLWCKPVKDSIMDHKHEGSWVSPYILYIGIVITFILKNIIFILGLIIILYLYINIRKIKSYIKYKYRK
jgi:mannosyltransferase OCH1-like enzyme